MTRTWIQKFLWNWQLKILNFLIQKKCNQNLKMTLLFYLLFVFNNNSFFFFLYFIFLKKIIKMDNFLPLPWWWWWKPDPLIFTEVVMDSSGPGPHLGCQMAAPCRNISSPSPKGSPHLVHRAQVGWKWLLSPAWRTFPEINLKRYDLKLSKIIFFFFFFKK